MNKISWGIIGCGDVTEVKSGPAFNLIANSELVAVMRRDAHKAADYAQRHSVEKWYSDASQLINDEKVNAIYIATPPDSHEKYTIEAFKAGKPVYVEKPMALDSTECKRMLDAAGTYSCKLSIAHYRRAQPRFLKILELIREKTIGDVKTISMIYKQAFREGTENTWRVNPAISGGGLFHDLAPHQLDLMIYFFGIPHQVDGRSWNQAGHYEADDSVQANLLFENGIEFKGLWDFNAATVDEADVCKITGTKGNIRFSVFGDLCELTLNDQTTQLQFDHLPHVQQPMIEQVVNYFLGISPNPCPAEDGLAVMKMMDKITGRV